MSRVGGTPPRSCNLCESTHSRIRYTIGDYTIVDCVSCGLTYMLETISPQELLDYYGKAYYDGTQEDGYADYVGRRETRKAHFRSLLPKLRRYLSTVSPRVLDVGCATGFFLEVMQEAGGVVQGVDISAYASDYARRELGLDVRTGTLEDAGFPQGAYDLVTLWDVLEHLSNPKGCLETVHNLLKADGLLVVSTGDISGATARIYRAEWELMAPPGHLFYFSRRTLFAMLRRVGFVPMDCDSDGAFLVNQRKEGVSTPLQQVIQKVHRNRWLNALLRRLRLGSIMTVYAKKCGAS
jgi:2-polyprenyl-3-methyl-5-hydroxy-6-metoxy-1,4-benzoquinol methylase